MKNYILLSALVFIISSCFNQNSTGNFQYDTSTPIASDTLVDAEPFLMNTIYIFYGLDNNGVWISNYNYTPYTQRVIDHVTVEMNLDNNYAIVNADNEERHQIIKIEYKKINGDIYDKFAIIYTDKGEIVITKHFHFNDYGLYVKNYERNYSIESGVLPYKMSKYMRSVRPPENRK